MEINTNLERFYVVEQRQFITGFFDTQAVQKTVLLSGIELPTEIYIYKESLELFNTALKDAKDFEEQSFKHVDQKTRFNAEMLHQKKEKTEELFKTLRPGIITAQKTMRDLLNAA